MKTFLCVLALVLAALMAAAQTSAAKPIPRAPDGKPDLSGIWQAGGVSLYGERTSVAQPVTPVRAQPAPYQAWAEAKVKEHNDGLGKADPLGHCFLPGVPRITSMPMPLEIMQKPGRIAILYEAFHGFRIIPTDGSQHPDDLDPTFLGDSVAHWDGDTLVVDVTGFNDKTWLDGRGHFHSDQLHVVERYTRTPEDTITVEVTMEDPKVMTKPWVINLTLRHPPPSHRVMEYECLENNQDVPHLTGPQAGPQAGPK